MCGAVHCSDIAILGVHRKPPLVEHDRLINVCEIPTTIAACPTAAIKPYNFDDEDGKKVKSGSGQQRTLHVLRQLLHHVPGHAPGRPGRRRHRPVGRRQGVQRPVHAQVLQIGHPVHARTSRRVGPETVQAVRKMVEVYAADARPYERMGEWIERIGWEQWFKLVGFEFTHHHIDDYRFAMTTWRHSTQFKFTD